MIGYMHAPPLRCWLLQVLVVTPTADGNSVDVDYDMSNQRLDAWAARHGVAQVRMRSN